MVLLGVKERRPERKKLVVGVNVTGFVTWNEGKEMR